VIFEDLYLITYVVIYYLVGIIDTFIRPLETEEKEEENYVKFIVLLFFASPWLFVLSIEENEWLFGSRSWLVSIFGLLIYLISGCFVLLSRIQLGKQATGTLVIRKDHELVNKGVYRWVRHPMYFGSILGVIGFWLVSQAIIVPAISLLMYFWVFHNRLKYEEQILIDQFGIAYEKYMSETKKLIPFIY
jgi:protein-S-isoprenylcysteine O-methyltransferase Ste14